MDFLRPSTLYPIFVFFKTRVFYATFFPFFLSNPPSIFTRNEISCVQKGFLRVFGTMRLTGDLHQKIFLFKKNFSDFFVFKIFSVDKDVFYCFKLTKSGFRVLCVSLCVIFGAVKLMKFQQYWFLPLVLCMILLIWFSLQKFATFLTSVCESRLRLCVQKVLKEEQCFSILCENLMRLFLVEKVRIYKQQLPIPLHHHTLMKHRFPPKLHLLSKPP